MNTPPPPRPQLTRSTKIGLLAILLFWGGVVAVALIARARQKPPALPARWLQPFDCPGLLSRVAECETILAPYLERYVEQRDAADGVASWKSSLRASFATTAVAQVLARPTTLPRCRRLLARARGRRPGLVAKLRACYRRPTCDGFASCLWEMRGSLEGFVTGD